MDKDRAHLSGALMVCGTASDVGKSVIVAGLCRWLARSGISVAPFKAQNMALNSYVTMSGGEIGRAQAAQAFAAGIEPEIAMNPVLLKPTGERTSQVIVGGQPIGELDAITFQETKSSLLPIVREYLDGLRERFDVVILEGAGSPAEINLASEDIVNLGLAQSAGIPAVLVGDIERGGVFAALHGTVSLLDGARRRLLKGFVINKFRGDFGLLDSGITQIEELTGLEHLGTLPYKRGIQGDEEDSLSLERLTRSDGKPTHYSGKRHVDVLDVAMIGLARISNFTDVEPLIADPSVSLRLVSDPRLLGIPDLIIIPGTKSTVADLEILKDCGMVDAILAAYREGSVLLGICGGFQILGRKIYDKVESDKGEADGLGLLDVVTRFEAHKTLERRRGTAGAWCLGSPEISGYEIHHGVPEVGNGCIAFASLSNEDGSNVSEGAVSVNRRVFGTSMHGIFENDQFRNAFLFTVSNVREKRFESSGLRYGDLREARMDRLADLMEDHLAMERIMDVIGECPR